MTNIRKLIIYTFCFQFAKAYFYIFMTFLSTSGFFYCLVAIKIWLFRWLVFLDWQCKLRTQNITRDNVKIHLLTSSIVKIIFISFYYISIYESVLNKSLVFVCILIIVSILFMWLHYYVYSYMYLLIWQILPRSDHRIYLQSVQKIIKTEPDIQEMEVFQFLLEHINLDIESLHQILGKGKDDIFLMMHFILNDIVMKHTSAVIGEHLKL